MSILNILLAVYVCIPLVLLIVISQRLNKKRTIEFFDKLHGELKVYFSELKHPIDEYTFYTNNHPYYWQKTTKEEMIKIIENTITKSLEARRGLINPAIYSISKDENEKSIFIVAERNFDFSRIKTEKEYQEHLKNVAHNIKTYKAKA